MTGRTRIAPPGVGDPDGTPADYRLPPELARRSQVRALAASFTLFLTVCSVAGLIGAVAVHGALLPWVAGVAVCGLAAACAQAAARMQAPHGPDRTEPGRTEPGRTEPGRPEPPSP